ncbi:hypothetical protein DV872_14410 [Oceanispirochaeta sp. M1]|nr:hypothetical protein DV872_14410 [Oceanispirochaeta sp. M1]
MSSPIGIQILDFLMQRIKYRKIPDNYNWAELRYKKYIHMSFITLKADTVNILLINFMLPCGDDRI